MRWQIGKVNIMKENNFGEKDQHNKLNLCKIFKNK